MPDFSKVRWIPSPSPFFGSPESHVAFYSDFFVRLDCDSGRWTVSILRYAAPCDAVQLVAVKSLWAAKYWWTNHLDRYVFKV